LSPSYEAIHTLTAATSILDDGPLDTFWASDRLAPCTARLCRNDRWFTPHHHKTQRAGAFVYFGTLSI